MIVHAFLRWVETARAADRAKAASVLARAYSRSRIAPDDRHAAEMAMIFLLDDPAPMLRLALSEASQPHRPIASIPAARTPRQASKRALIVKRIRLSLYWLWKYISQPFGLCAPVFHA